LQNLIRLINVEKQSAKARFLGDLRVPEASREVAQRQIDLNVAKGLISEIDARKQLLEVQRAYAAEVLPALNAQVEALEQKLREQIKLAEAISTDPNAAKNIAGTREEILKLQQRILEVQRSTIDPIFAEIRNGITNDLLGAFNDFLNAGTFGL